MSLQSQIEALATRIATEFNAVRSEISSGGSGGGVTASATPPTSPSVGDGWLRTTDYREFVYLENTWIDISGAGSRGNDGQSVNILTGTSAPNDADGEPDGTIYIQT